MPARASTPRLTASDWVTAVMMIRMPMLRLIIRSGLRCPSRNMKHQLAGCDRRWRFGLHSWMNMHGAGHNLVICCQSCCLRVGV